MLALEIFNKPTVQYRIEAFCFFYINAWELLLKARILNTTNSELSIYYKKQRGKPRRGQAGPHAGLVAPPATFDPPKLLLLPVALRP